MLSDRDTDSSRDHGGPPGNRERGSRSRNSGDAAPPGPLVDGQVPLHPYSGEAVVAALQSYIEQAQALGIGLNVHLLPPMTEDYSDGLLEQLWEVNQKVRPGAWVFLPLNIGGSHWVGVLFSRAARGDALTIEVFDPLGAEPGPSERLAVDGTTSSTPSASEEKHRDRSKAEGTEKEKRQPRDDGELGGVPGLLALLGVCFPHSQIQAVPDAPQNDDTSCGLLVALWLFARMQGTTVAALLGQGGPDHWHSLLMHQTLFQLAAVSSYEDYLGEFDERRELLGLHAKNVFWAFYLCGALFAAQKEERKLESYWWTSDLYLRPGPGGQLALTNLPGMTAPSRAWAGSSSWIALHFNINTTASGSSSLIEAPHLTLRGWNLSYYSNYPEAKPPRELDATVRTLALAERNPQRAFMFQRPAYGGDAPYSRQLAVYIGDDPSELLSVPRKHGVTEDQARFLFQLHAVIRACVLAVNKLDFAFAELDWKTIKKGITEPTKARSQTYAIEIRLTSCCSEDGIEFLFDPGNRTLTVRHRLGLHVAQFRLDPPEDDQEERRSARRRDRDATSGVAPAPTSGCLVLLDAEQPIAVGDGLHESDAIEVSGQQMARAAFTLLLRRAGTWRVNEDGSYQFSVLYPFLPVFALIRHICATRSHTAVLGFFRFFEPGWWNVPVEAAPDRMRATLDELSKHLVRFREHLFTASAEERTHLMHRLRAGAQGWRRLLELGATGVAAKLCAQYMKWMVPTLVEAIDAWIWSARREDLVCLEGFLIQVALLGGLRGTASVLAMARDRPWVLLVDVPPSAFYGSVSLGVYHASTKKFPLLLVIFPSSLEDIAHLYPILRQLQRAGLDTASLKGLEAILRRNRRKK